jgi:L-lactate dehydrogenase
MVTAMLHGEYGLSDVCLSLPTLVGNGAVQGHIMPKLAPDEVEKLLKSGAALKSVIANLKL